MPKNPRQMPPKGFYVYSGQLAANGYKEAIYTTGERGGGNHKYCRCFGTAMGGANNELEWATLLWSCVPSLKELQDSYTFYPTWEAIPAHYGFPQPPPDKVKPEKVIKPPHPTKIRKEDVVPGLRAVIIDVMKGISNYGFYLHTSSPNLNTILENVSQPEQTAAHNPTILQNGQHLVVVSFQGKNLMVRCEETGVTGAIFLCDLTQKCHKCP